MIIGLSGYAGSGKDTVGQILCTRYGFTRVSFADKLKEKTAQAFNIPVAYFHDRSLKDAALLDFPIVSNDSIIQAVLEGLEKDHSVFTPRLLAIFYANCMRAIDKDYWVKQAVADLDMSKNIVITDVRYENEAIFLKKLHGTLVKIDRFDTPQLHHISETQLQNFKFDYTINNRGSHRDLVEEVEKFYTERVK